MAFTNQSDLYVAVHDEGINRVVRHIQRQRPSLFNYGTAFIQANPELLCKPIDAAPGVSTLMTVQPPIPLFGAEQMGLNYCFQFTAFEIDFHPGNEFELPPELHPPLPEQRFAFRASLCGGIGCPSREGRFILDLLLKHKKVLKRELQPASRGGATNMLTYSAQPFRVADSSLITHRRISHEVQNYEVLRPLDPAELLRPQEDRVEVFPTQSISCFCLNLFAKGRSSIHPLNELFKLELDGIEIVDLRPVGLENSLECYLLLVANHGIFPQVNEAVSNLLFSSVQLGELGSLRLGAPAEVAHNPAIEEHQLKLFLNVDEISLDIPPFEISDSSSESPEIVRTTKSRLRNGPAHITAALSENLFQRAFTHVRDSPSFHISGERTIADGGLGKVVADFDIRFHLQNGQLTFNNNNTIKIDELDIKWDKLSIRFKFDINEICTPRVCIPFTNICTPQWCIFESDSDFEIPLNIPAIFTSELSLTVSPKVYYGTSPVNQWLVYLEAGPIDIDLIDVSDTIGDLLDNAIATIVDALGLPDFVEDILGVFADVIRTLLDIGDDAGEWIADLVFNTFGISFGISELLAAKLLDKTPILKLPDPLVVMPEETGPPLLNAVGIPIEFLGAEVNTDEMVLSIDIKE